MRDTSFEEGFFNKASVGEKSPQISIYNTNVVWNKVCAMFLSLTKHASEQFNATLPLLELTTANTHIEQIWQQIELQILSILNLIKPNLKLSSSITQNFGRTESVAWKQRMRNDSTIGRKLHDPVFPSAEVPRINHNEHLVPGNILAVEKALVKEQFLSQFTGEENKVHKSIKTPIPVLSSFQLVQERLSKEIDKLETRATTKESWSFVGEASGKQRPLNSALESDLEFNQVSQPRPNISIEATHTLENLIKQRILLNKWDDVEATDVIQISTKNNTQLSDAKAKVGLGEIYAKSYMNQRSNKNEEVLNTADSKDDDLICSARNLFDNVFLKLTSLTDLSMNTEKSSDQILSERKSSNSHTTKRTPEEIFMVRDNRKQPMKKRSKLEKIPLPKLAQVDSIHPERAQTVKISAESANLNQNYDSKKSKHSIFDKSSKVFNSLEMLKTSVSHKQKALDSQRNVNRKKL